MNKMFKIEGDISPKMSGFVSLIGFALLIFVWYLVTAIGNVPSSIFPSPQKVLSSYGDLLRDGLIHNTWFSVKLNLLGYMEAVLVSIPIGFAMGLIPAFRSLVSKYFDAFRFLPLPAVTGVFVVWFGIELAMKVHFLSFGIMLYLIPVIVQRIDEIESIHKQTITTLGASSWQKIKYLYFPYTISKISDDIRVLIAISWTYIVIVELLNKEGGIGGMIFTASKQSYTHHIFALIVIIIIIGYIQDLLFKALDRFFFPFKHDGQIKTSFTEKLSTMIVKK